jgi:hypothetical protein
VTVPQVDETTTPERVNIVSAAQYPSFSALHEASIVSLTVQNGPKYVVTPMQRQIEGHTRNLSFVEGKRGTQVHLNSLAVEDGLKWSLQRLLTSPGFERVKTELGVSTNS